jgi:hypothetical protein
MFHHFDHCCAHLCLQTQIAVLLNYPQLENADSVLMLNAESWSLPKSVVVQVM